MMSSGLIAVILVGAPSFPERAYFHEASIRYQTAEYAAGTNSVIHRYSREDPFGIDNRYDFPDQDRKRIPDEPIAWGLKGLRNVRDIGGWTGLRTGMIYRGSQLERVEDAKDGIDPETRMAVTELWKLRTDFDLRGVKEWGVREYGERKLVEFQEMNVPKISHRFPSYEKLFENAGVVSAALKDLAKPETYPTYIHCAGGADRTGSLVFILEALCGVPEWKCDIDYELTSFATVFGIRDRNVTLGVSFKRFKDRFRKFHGRTLQEQVENACRTAFGLSDDEIASIRRLLTPETEWVYSLIDQKVRNAKTKEWVRLRKGWNELRRDVELEEIGKIVRQATPPPFPNEQERAYEFERVDRREDNVRPVAKLEQAGGWKVECENAEAQFETVSERRLFGKTVTRLSFRADWTKGTNSAIRIIPPKPIEVQPFDSVAMWMYGNYYSYDPAPGAKNVKVMAVMENFRGETFEVPAAENWCAYWFQNHYHLMEHEKPFAKFGGYLKGFELRGIVNTNSVQMLYFSNFATYRQKTDPTTIPERPGRPVRLFDDQDQGMNRGAGVLNFPTTPDTVIPPVAGEDPDLEFRFPEKPEESWDDLAFRVKGGEWIKVALGGGPKPNGRGGTYRFRRVGDSIVCDMMVRGGKVNEVLFGDLEYAKLPNARKIPVPYYLAPVLCERMSPEVKRALDIEKRPGLLVTELGGRPLFIAATWDWTQSQGSFPFSDSKLAPMGGVQYFPKSDGRRNDVCERFVWSFSRKPVDALANIPNPKSPYRHIAGKRAFAFARSYDLPLVPSVNPQENETRERMADYWTKVRRFGVKDLVVNGHEKMWRDYMDSFTFKTNAAPLKGGDRAMKDFRSFLKGLGYRVGPYNNFTDYAPVNENFDPDNIAIMPETFVAGMTNEFFKAWTRTYLPKPVYSVHMMETLLPVVKEKFEFECAYSDVHTAYAPWFRVDHDWRMPGSAAMCQTFYAIGELMERQKYIWNGPVYSEGLGHMVYAGLSDGDFARDDDYFAGTYSSDPNQEWKLPWLVDYDLKRFHPLNCCPGTLPRTFYGRHAPASPLEYADRYLAYCLAFGHALCYVNGFFMRDNRLEVNERLELKCYYMPLALTARITQAEAVEIRYGDERGELLDTAAAIATGAYRLSRVYVKYDDGSEVAVNGGKGEFLVRLGGVELALGENEYAGRSGDGKVRVFSGKRAGGCRADLSVCRDYVFIDGRGRWTEFSEGATDGMLVRLNYTSVVGRPLAEGEEDVLLLGGATRAELPYAAKKVTAYDLAGRVTKELKPEIVNGRTVIRQVDGAISYRTGK